MHSFLRVVLILVFALCAVPASADFTPISLAFAPHAQFPREDFTVTGLRLSLLYGQHRRMYGLDLGLVGNVTDSDFVGLAIAGGFNRTTGPAKAIGLQAAGIANVNHGRFSAFGAQAALVNYNLVEAFVAGVQVGGLANLANKTTIYGAQLGVYNDGCSIYGFQLGVVNRANSLNGVRIGSMSTSIFGVQAGLVNVTSSESSILGFQLGAVNLSGHSNINGIQAGFFNKADTVTGLQIGFINISQALHGLQIGFLNFSRSTFFSVSPFLNIGF